MKEIKSSRNCIVMVDDCDYDFLMRYKWYSNIRKDNIYCCSIINGKTVYMHRLIINAKNGEMVDHKDGDGMNNQRNNIRICTNSQNQMNKTATGKSKYLGVCVRNNYRSINDKKYSAKIKVKEKYIHIGVYENECDAALAYNEYAKKYHGEYARLNVIDDKC